MKALVYTQPNHVAMHEVDYPSLQDGEVILRITAAGICGSDMHAYHGKDPRRLPGLILGHELAGIVHESASPLFRPGQRVTANPSIACGVCANCVSGRDNLCLDRGMVGMSRPGAFAQFMAIPARCVIALPDGMSDVAAALTEPAATALHSVNLAMKALSRPLPEARALVIGGGAIGLLTALLLHSYGCRRIALAETNPLRRESAARHTAAQVYDPINDPARSGQFELVVDAVGAGPTRTLALDSVRPGGTVVHIGLQDWGSQIDMRKLTLAEITLLGSYIYTMADMHATVAALHEGAFGNLGWVEQRSLGDGPQAFAALDSGAIAAGKLVLVPELED